MESPSIAENATPAADMPEPRPMRLTLHCFFIDDDDEAICRVEDDHGRVADLLDAVLEDGPDVEEWLAGDAHTWTVSTVVFEGCLLEEYDELRQPENTAAGISGNVYVIRQEVRSVSRPLTAAQRAEVGERMAEALRRRSQLENELDEIRKSFNVDIKAADKEAMAAAREWRHGVEEYETRCNVLADYLTQEIVTVECEAPQREVNRRPMTAEERQRPLPGLYPEASQVAASEPALPDEPGESGETAPEAPDQSANAPFDGPLCIECVHMNREKIGELPEPCLACSGCGNGPENHWTPRHECHSCSYNGKRVSAFPCRGCSLNPNTTYVGDVDHWCAAERQEVVQ